MALSGEGRSDARGSLVFMRRSRNLNALQQQGPMATMGNYLFDVALVLGVGLFLMALNSFGLGDLISKNDLTVVMNPGTRNIRILTRENGQVTKYSNTGKTAQGEGTAMGTIYKLNTGQLVYVPAKR
jgi:hypothetical protein